MPRRGRAIEGGLAYHILNRGAGRMTLFDDAADYRAFESVLAEALRRYPLRLLAYVVMPNHWHVVVWPRRDEGPRVSALFRWLTVTHAVRWRLHRHTVGTGPVYQGRFKSFPVAKDSHLLSVIRYVERNPLRAGLVRRAELWQWGSLWRRTHGDGECRAVLSDWPVEVPRNWTARVNQPQTPAELDALRCCVLRGRPFGGDEWVHRMVARLGLESSIRPRGRPRKKEDE